MLVAFKSAMSVALNISFIRNTQTSTMLVSLNIGYIRNIQTSATVVALNICYSTSTQNISYASGTQATLAAEL